METTYEIPAQTRTLYFRLLGNNREYENEYENFKFKLNLPRLLFCHELTRKIATNPTDCEYYLRNCGEYLWTMKAINENNQLCWTPLPNILKYNAICLGGSKYPKTIDEFKERYYNSTFSEAGTLHIRKYLNCNPNDLNDGVIFKFLQNWQTTGNLELKLVQNE
jgi:hypothetical protein